MGGILVLEEKRGGLQPSSGDRRVLLVSDALGSRSGLELLYSP